MNTEFDIEATERAEVTLSANHKPVSAETADAMHATITGLMRENERLREALAGVTRILEAFSYTTQLGKTQRARLESARAALGVAA